MRMTLTMFQLKEAAKHNTAKLDETLTKVDVLLLKMIIHDALQIL